MSCENWRAKLDGYVDGELAPAEANSLSAHLRGCAACAAEALDRVQLKRSVALAGKRYEPRAQFRARITKLSVTRHRRDTASQWKVLLIPALALLLISLGVKWYVGSETARRDRVYSELADLHVTTLASATPVDVLSSDRHTVKPWFQGKTSFSPPVPDLSASGFTLIGGRLEVMRKRPAAAVVYKRREHIVSLYVVPSDGASSRPAAEEIDGYHLLRWTENGLSYAVVSDLNMAELGTFAELIRTH